MPLNLSEIICNSAKDAGGSYLSNPIYTSLLIVFIIFLILIWSYWKSCSILKHITTCVYIFIVVTIMIICHNEVINNQYAQKYKNKAVDDLANTLVAKRDEELMSKLAPQFTTMQVPNIPTQQQIQPSQSSQLRTSSG